MSWRSRSNILDVLRELEHLACLWGGGGGINKIMWQFVIRKRMRRFG
jgi:hypothetical protein